MTCSTCKQQGHNKNGCKKDGVTKEPRTKRKTGKIKESEASTSKGTKAKGKAEKPTKFQATSSTQEASTSRNSTITRTRGKETMGVGGSVYTHMPTKKSLNLEKPYKEKNKRKSTQKNKKTFISTQESHNQ